MMCETGAVLLGAVLLGAADALAWWELLALCGFAFLAGFVDSIVGGGGLIQLPAVLVFLPGEAVATAFGTNKFASIAGTGAAARQYARQVEIEWRIVLPAAGAAFLCSLVGARAVSLLNPVVLRPLILLLLIAVAVYTFARKDFGAMRRARLSATKQAGAGLFVGGILGFYDGFFGPGTGSFLIFIFVGVFGYDFLLASASSKIVNTATNLAALIYFAFAGHILYAVALPMAFCNIIGSFTGSRLAIRKGSGFVRVLFLVVLSALIIKFAYDIFRR